MRDHNVFGWSSSDLKPDTSVPPMPTSGNVTLSLVDGPTTYNLTFDFGASCASAIVPNFLLRNRTVANVTMAEMWNDIASSTDEEAREIMKKEMNDTIALFNQVAGELLNVPPADFITPTIQASNVASPSTIETSKRALSFSWVRTAYDKIADIFYQEGNISWLLLVLPIYAGIGYSVQRITFLIANGVTPVENLSVIGVGAVSILVKAAVGRLYDKTELLQKADRFILRLVTFRMISDLITTIRGWNKRDNLALPLTVPEPDMALEALDEWRNGNIVGDSDEEDPTGFHRMDYFERFECRV